MPKKRKPRPTKLTEGIKVAKGLLQTLPRISKDIDRLSKEYYNKYMFYEYRDIIELKNEILEVEPALRESLYLLGKIIPFYEELPPLFEYRPIENLEDLYKIVERIEFIIDFLSTQCKERARTLSVRPVSYTHLTLPTTPYV